MSDIATYVRIYNADPTDELVEKRTSAIKDLNDNYISKKTSAIAILAMASDAAGAISNQREMSTDLANGVEAALRNHSPAFVRTGHELEMLVCVLLGLLQRVKGAKASNGVLARTDIVAAGLWSALSFQPACKDIKLEALRADVQTSSQELIRLSAESARKRLVVPDFAAAISEAADYATFQAALKPGTGPTINALRANALLDREEIDLLWWVLGDWSELLGERISTMPPEAMAVVNGVELGRILRRLPANAHKHLALRNISSDSVLNLQELAEVLDDRRAGIARGIVDTEKLSKCPSVFPLLSALCSGETDVVGAKVKRSVRDWGARALLEASIFNIMFHDQDK